MQSVTVHAPAKLNLTLGIRGITANGYHSMDMLMQAVSLYETVTLRKSKRLTLSLPGSNVAAGVHNTAYKAALAFFHATGLLAGADIVVQKAVPVRAGMAGGSADAAAVLVGLNALYGANLSHAELCCIGATIGADVPFAIVGGTMRSEGIGEVLTQVPPCPACYITVCMPKFGVSTPQAFKRYDTLGSPVQPNNDAAIAALAAGDLHALCAEMVNALQFSSESTENEPICNILRSCGALAALMTGSGAAVFGVFETKQAAEHAKETLQRAYADCWVVTPVAHGARLANTK